MKRKNVLYVDIADKLKKDIQNSVYPVGEMLPTEIELENMFDVSKITVRKAIEVLSQQGYVEKKSGKGTTVISNRLFNKLSKGKSFSSILEEKGLEIDKKIISIELIETCNEPDLQGETDWLKATKIVRVYYLDGKPYILFNHYLPAAMLKSIDKNIRKKSMYWILAEQNYNVDRIKDRFSVAKLENKTKKVLKTDNAHALKRTRQTYDPTNRLIEISLSFCDSSMHPYEIDFEV